MSVYRRIISFIYPERCPFCGAVIEAQDVACERCLAELERKQQPVIRGAMGYRCVSSFIYDGKVRRMLIRIKYHDHTQHIPQIAAILAKDVKSIYGDGAFDFITFVPMHPKDQRQRGYNQSEILAKELAKLLNLPCHAALNKIKRTKKQHRLTYQERRKNLTGAFAVIDREAVSGRRVLIVDDIVTSGYTLGNCCRVLARAKPSLICCATVANANTQVDPAAVI